MAFKHVLKISSIYEFFGSDSKMLKNVETYWSLTKMQFDADLMIIRGEILSSMKNKTYMSEMNLNNSGDIISASCACPREIRCHHIANLALFGHYNISVTNKECSWNVPKELKVKPVHTADELYPPKPYAAIGEKITDETRQILKEKLNSFGNTVNFTWCSQVEPKEYI